MLNITRPRDVLKRGKQWIHFTLSIYHDQGDLLMIINDEGNITKLIVSSLVLKPLPPFSSTPLAQSSPAKDLGQSTVDCISPLAVACRWWWGLAAGGPARWTGADSHGWELHCVSSGSPRWGRCSRSACSPAAGSAGGSRSSWARRWETSNSPHSSCLSPQRHVAPGGCRSCSASSSCWTSSGCHMNTPPPCASRRNWTDSIKQCSVFPSPVHTVKKLSCHAS